MCLTLYVSEHINGLSVYFDKLRVTSSHIPFKNTNNENWLEWRVKLRGRKTKTMKSAPIDRSLKTLLGLQSTAVSCLRAFRCLLVTLLRYFKCLLVKFLCFNGSG